MALSITRVHASEGNCHLYGGEFLDRVIAFLSKYDCDGDPEYIWHELSLEMKNERTSRLCLAAINEEGEMVGHLLAEAQFQYGIQSVMITQLEINHDSAAMRGELMRKGWPFIIQWAENISARSIRCWALNEKVASVFAKFGFNDKGVVVMEHKLQAKGE